MPQQSLAKKRTASINPQKSNKKIKLTIKPWNLKDDNNETDNDATNKQKTDTVETVKKIS
jgi:hypothetical protein